MTNHDRLFGATKIPFGGPPMGTLRIREKIISIEMGCFVTLYISEHSETEQYFRKQEPNLDIQVKKHLIHR